jgi:DNA-binding NarL/FixJ family response regulator
VPKWTEYRFLVIEHSIENLRWTDRGIKRSKLEILELIAQGMSDREIAKKCM